MIRDVKSVAVALVLFVGLFATRAWSDEAVYDELPAGPAAEVARLYYTVLSVPGLSDWDDLERSALLDAVTQRHRDRLVDRAPWASEPAVLDHVARLAGSELGMERPELVARTCARYGLMDGPCATHAGYVRRALVLEEMLAQGQLSLEALETELAGAARPGFAGALSVSTGRTADKLSE